MSGKYREHPSYIEAGVKRLGRIPSHWVLKRLKHMARIKNGQDYKHIETENVEDGYPVIGSGGRFAFATEFIFEGESVLLGRKGTIDKPLYVNSAFWTVDTMFYTQVFKDTCARYLYYCSVTIPFNYYSTNTALPSMTQEDLGGNYFAVPDAMEQTQIANFLDHETAKIDTLIDKQQQLIKLLKEKRQAVISHAVTKGLNPAAPMKDSGVEWLGEVPEHWKLKPLKYLCRFSGGGTPSKDNLSYWENGSIPWVSPKDMRTFWIADTQDKLTESAVSESSTNYVEPEALLMVVRSGILQRKIPIAINTVQVTLNQDMKALRFGREMDVHFAANFILGNQDSLLLEWAKQGATVESIEHEYLANSLIPVPPVPEQLEISQFIEKKMEILNALEGKAVEVIELFKERRTALISAAVTGKIDVRNWQPNRWDERGS